MFFVPILLLIVFFISAILLIVIIMLQDDQGEGLGGLFGGGSNTAFGSRAGNILTKTTSVLAAIMLGSAVLLAFAYKSSDTQDNIERKAKAQELKENNWFVPNTSTEAVKPEVGSLTGEIPLSTDFLTGPGVTADSLDFPSERSPLTESLIQESEKPPVDSAVPEPQTTETKPEAR